ncbi:hypothetical protein PHMEG_00028817 [Phytophthora megakarya]|uniref:Uncharacterized protein n=1 Tax=Phytophthora megakarya TaxID=4795 RepID=A0A225V4Q7_9STRA|nr:hypothetical protein PHMEG_00028817 [Phytophthora megakarya]
MERRAKADRQIAELRAALAARDELERIRNEEYRAARTAQAAQAKLSQEAWDRREAEFQERTEQEMERKEVSGQEFAGLQAQMYLIEKERAREWEESIQFRAEADRRMEAVTEKCDQAIAKAAADIDETKLQADQELSRIKREMEHQAREDRGPGSLRWEDEDDSGYGYQYDVENDEAYDGLVDQEEVFRAEAPGGWGGMSATAVLKTAPTPEGEVTPEFPDPRPRAQYVTSWDILGNDVGN